MASAAAPMVVCVTGASGFVGSHVVLELLRRGHTVRAAVRNPSDPRNAFFSRLPVAAGVSADRLTVVEGDLVKPGSYDAAFAGCEVVIHTAASVKMEYDVDPMTEIVNPTVEGMKNVIGSAKKMGVRRIVHTSSGATIQGIESERPKECQGKMFTEAEFGTVKRQSPTWGTYGYSKTLAEKALDEMWDGEYAVFYPTLVLGPGLSEAVKSSLDIIKLCVNREYPVVPKMYCDWIDVRDVAGSHVAAAEVPDVYLARPTPTPEMPRPPTPAKFILSQKRIVQITDLAVIINKRFPHLNCPESTTPNWLMWIMSLCDKRITDDFLRIIAVPCCPFDNSKLLRTLESGGLGYTCRHTDLEQTVVDTVESFYRLGLVKDAKSSDPKYATPGTPIAKA